MCLTFSYKSCVRFSGPRFNFWSLLSYKAVKTDGRTDGHTRVATSIARRNAASYLREGSTTRGKGESSRPTANDFARRLRTPKRDKNNVKTRLMNGRRRQINLTSSSFRWIIVSACCDAVKLVHETRSRRVKTGRRPKWREAKLFTVATLRVQKKRAYRQQLISTKIGTDWIRI